VTTKCNTYSYLESIKLFKRSQRSFQIQNNIQPRNQNSSATQEAFAHYSELYDSISEEIIPPPTCSISLPVITKTPFSPEIISRVIKKYDSSKACGPDNLHIRIIKCLASKKSFCNLMDQLFRLLYRIGITPTAWNESLLHLLIKDKDQPFADKTRPISLTQVFRRVFEKILYQSWQDQNWTKVHDYQAGFRHGYSTYSHILLADQLSRKSPHVSIFLDLTNAFDRVNHKKLISILQERKCPARDLRLIFSLMVANCRSILTCNRTKYPTPIIRRQGVFQGSILSPFLFNIYIDSLAVSLNKISPSLIFADDIQIIAQNIEDAKKCLDKACKWAKESNMIFNVQKCGIISRAQTTLSIGKDIIPHVKSYKYLGVPMTYFGVAWNEFFDKLRKKTSSYQNAIESKGTAWSSYTKLIIYRTFIRPTSEYALPLVTQWAKRQEPNILKEIMAGLELQHKCALSWIFGRKGFAALFENMSGLEDPQFRVTRLEASLCLHLKRLANSNPLHEILKTFLLSTSRNDFLSFCRDSILVSEFYRQAKVKWKTFILQKRKLHMFQKNGILHKYIENSCKSPSGTDNCLRHVNADVYIKWRSNCCFLTRICPVCKQNFNRSHINSCLTLPSTLDKILGSKKFQTASKSMKECAGEKCSFNILDFLLNRKMYDEFDELMKWLDKKLPAAGIEPPTNMLFP
jgi:hypothetical protein